MSGSRRIIAPRRRTLREILWRFSPLIFFVMLVAILSLGVMYHRTSKRLSVAEDPVANARMQKEETRDLMEKLNKHILLPIDEIPTVATITDITALAARQPFYAQAQNGDKLLIYIQSQKAILYSPSRDIVINVGPVAGEDPKNTQ